MDKTLKIKKGAIKAFRQYLNEKFKDSPKYKNWQWHQETRGYGDYLYHQDRAMFDEAFSRALRGNDPDFVGFDGKKWRA